MYPAQGELEIQIQGEKKYIACVYTAALIRAAINHRSIKVSGIFHLHRMDRQPGEKEGDSVQKPAGSQLAGWEGGLVEGQVCGEGARMGFRTWRAAHLVS